MAVNSNDDERFKVVEYSPEKAEMIGYSKLFLLEICISQFLKEKGVQLRF